MARHNKPVPTTIAQAALQDLQRIDRKIALLEQQTTFAVQQIAVSAIADPVEGEVVIDHTDNHRLKWYSNGMWHSVCDCAEILRDLLIIGLNNGTNGENNYSVYGFNLETLTFSQLAAPITDDEWWAAWWSHDGTKVYAVREVDFPIRAKAYSMNADGTGLTEIGYDGDFQASNYVPYTGTPAKFALSNNVDQIKVLNEDGSIDVIWTTAEHAVAPFNAPAAETMTLIVNENDNWKTGLPGFVPRWNPLNNGQLMYMATPSGFSNTQIWLVNEDGTDKHQIFDGGTQWDVEEIPVWSPDGTKIALMINDNFAYPKFHFWVIDVEGNILHQSPNLVEPTWDLRQEVLAWSPNSDKIALGLLTEPGIEIWDLASMTKTTPSGAGLDDIELLSWAELEESPNW
jgi:hypothetical protein